MEQFKLYLEEQVQIIENELTELKHTIDVLPPESNFPLSEYGDIKELTKEYRLKSNASFIKRLIPVSKKELINYVRTNELTKLELRKNRLEKVLSELNEAIKSIKDNQFTKELSRSNEIIKKLFDYSAISNLTSSELSRMLIIILKHTRITEHVISKIKQNIISYYNDEGILVKKDNYDTLRLLFDKLFMTVFTPREQDKNIISINEIMSHLKVEHLEPSESKSKEDLLKERESLQILRTYIKDGRVVKSTSTIEEFQTLLSDANIEQGIAVTLVNQMEERIIRDNEIAEELKKQQVIKTYLSPEELLYITKAIELETQTTGHLQALINRTKNDVISLCRYLDIIKDTEDYQETLDILSKRMAILKELINNLEKNTNKRNAFYYVTDSEQMPYLLRTIESLDITSYKDIYRLLLNLASHKQKGQLKEVVDGLNIYEINGDNYKIAYTRTYNEIIVINAYNSTFSNQDSVLNKAIITRLKELIDQPKTKEVKRLHSQYESMILRALNLDIIDQPLTLTKKER